MYVIRDQSILVDGYFEKQIYNDVSIVVKSTVATHVKYGYNESHHLTEYDYIPNGVICCCVCTGVYAA